MRQRGCNVSHTSLRTYSTEIDARTSKKFSAFGSVSVHDLQSQHQYCIRYRRDYHSSLQEIITLRISGYTRTQQHPCLFFDRTVPHNHYLFAVEENQRLEMSKSVASVSCASTTSSPSAGKQLTSSEHQSSEKHSDKISEEERRIAGFSDIFLLSKSYYW